MAEEIVNKVAQAQIEQIDLMDFVSKEQIISIDLKEQLWNEMVLKEKEFRSWVKDHIWDQYNDEVVCIYCSNDAIIPAWAFMLVTTQLEHARKVIFGSSEVAEEELFFENLKNWDIQNLADKRVMVKGC